MPKLSIGFGAVLIAIGLFGYFGSKSETPSLTALIPAAIGGVIAACGVAAHKPALPMHAMHLAVLVALIGMIAALGRSLSKIGLMASDDLSISRPLRLIFLTAIVCLVYVILCVRTFIVARRNRLANQAAK